MSRPSKTIGNIDIIKNCSRCSRCRDVCPAGIDVPGMIEIYSLYKANESNETERTKILSAASVTEDCIECGACTSCCPEKIAVMNMIRELAMQQI